MAKRKDNKNRALNDGETQRPNGTYAYRYTDLVGKRKTVYAKTLNELRKKETDIIIKLDKGIIDNGIALDEIYKSFIRKKKKFARAYEMYQYIYRNQLADTLLFQMPVSKIKKEHIVMLYSQMAQKYSKSTINHMQTIIRGCLDIALDNDLILRNPANRIMKDIDFRKEKNVVALTKAETELILTLFKPNKPQTDVIKFMLFTGVRYCEMAALTWEDIDFVNKYVDINKHMVIRNGKWVIENGAKTDNGVRKIPLSNGAINLLKDIKARRYFETADIEYDGYKGFVFLTSKNKIWRCANLDSIMKNTINRYNKKNNSDIRVITCHVLRHTFCTRLAEKGMKPDALMKIMGHKDYQITQKVYIDVEEDFVFEEFVRCNA